MSVEWVDFKGIKAKVSMETVLSHYDVRLRRVGADEFRGKCPLPTHSSTNSNDSFSVSFTRFGEMYRQHLPFRDLEQPYFHSRNRSSTRQKIGPTQDFGD
jgi:hypothetical protein